MAPQIFSLGKLIPFCAWKNSTLLLGEDAGRAPEVSLILYKKKHIYPFRESSPDSPVVYSMDLLVVPILTELPATFENATDGP